MSAEPIPFRAVVAGSGEPHDQGAVSPHAPGDDAPAANLGSAESYLVDQEAPVLLVGAGPGDPDLLTLDAEQALGVACEIVADRSLVTLLDALVAEGSIGPLGGATSPVTPSVSVVDPGAVRSPTTGPVVSWVEDDQPAVASLLGAHGRGPGAVRLYRGDPWFHPAGDAERAALHAAGVGFEILPGVTEELALTAAGGVPVQVRTMAVTTTFAFDRLGPDADGPDGTSAHPDLAVPADAAHTLVVRTSDLAATAARLADAAGRDGSDLCRPAAALPTGLHGGLAVGVRASLADLAAAAPPGGGVVLVGLVAALDTRLGAAAARPSTGVEMAGGLVRSGPGPMFGSGQAGGPSGAAAEAEPTMVVDKLDARSSQVRGVT